MDVARFVKSNLKLLILLLSIIQSILISYICFIGSGNLTKTDFLQLVPAVALAIWITPWLYAGFLRLRFSSAELVKMTVADETSMMISPEELKDEIRTSKRKQIIFSIFALGFVFAEFTYICKYVFNTPISSLMA
tara:strand:+ start:2705 stop:3109 length:405 start_codon:yes stop_codon:yes gene_type:complete